jgi:hypothetical protein
VLRSLVRDGVAGAFEPTNSSEGATRHHDAERSARHLVGRDQVLAAELAKVGSATKRFV